MNNIPQPIKTVVTKPQEKLYVLRLEKDLIAFIKESIRCCSSRISTVYDSRWGTKEFILSVTKSSGMSALPLTALE